MQSILSFYEQFILLSKANPLIASAIGLWGAGLLTYMIRNIPEKIADFTMNQLTTTLTFNNAGWNGNERTYQHFMTWFIDGQYARWSRSLSTNTDYVDGKAVVHLGVGYGNHFFMFRHRLFWFNKSMLDSQGTHAVKEQIRIRGLTRNQGVMRDLVKMFTATGIKPHSMLFIWDDGCWEETSKIPERSLGSVIMDPVVKHSLTTSIDAFMTSREWYISRGLPYKLTILLHGPPGTGKTSIVRALATYLDKDVYDLNLNSMSDFGFRKALMGVHDNNIVLIEDFDSCKALCNDNDPMGKPKDTETFLTKAGVINVLDGALPLDGVIVVLSTNYLDRIDSSVYRRGRVDINLRIGELEHPQVVEYIDKMYPGNMINHSRYQPIVGCELHSLFLLHRNDYQAFVSALLDKQKGV